MCNIFNYILLIVDKINKYFYIIKCNYYIFNNKLVSCIFSIILLKGNKFIIVILIRNK